MTEKTKPAVAYRDEPVRGIEQLGSPLFPENSPNGHDAQPSRCVLVRFVGAVQ
jgi:hypothetical protein